MFSASHDTNLLLTGYSGPGQLAIARATAETLRLPLLHFESRLEARAEMAIDEFRLRYGETRLRTLESEIIDEIALARGSLLYVSGHVLTPGTTLQRLSTTAVVLCLVAALDAILRRLHLAMGARYHEPAERDKAIGVLRRAWSIRGRANVHEIDTSGLTEAAIVELVIGRWRELSGVIDMGR
ncbi:MAG: shikimate kinase [Chloroflexota bacterium]|nr:shikimate kinase [Chloroflexota bacterium]